MVNVAATVNVVARVAAPPAEYDGERRRQWRPSLPSANVAAMGSGASGGVRRQWQRRLRRRLAPLPGAFPALESSS
jgi:hypothetical protein